MEALDLVRRGRRAGLDEDVIDAVPAADAVEEHLHWWLDEASGETLPVSALALVPSASRKP